MTVYVGRTTTIDIDRKKGLLHVYDLKTGKLLYTCKINPCIKSQ